MKNYKLHTSEGVRDYLGLELLIKEEIENRIKKLFLSNGYNLVKTPTFEYIDVYTVNGVQMPSLYNLINRQGEVLALRNDMTSSIARIVASKDKFNDIKKYCYISNTFRYPKLYQGKSHEFTQAGIEIVGSGSIKTEIECIRIAYQALEKININNFTIHIGSKKFVDSLLSDFNILDNDKEELLNIIEGKDFVKLRNKLRDINLDESKIKLITRLMEQAGRLTFLQSIIDDINGCNSISILEDLKKLYNELKLRNLQDKIVFDFSINSYANYYTGVNFQIFASGIGRAIVTGGRCDELFKKFGTSYKAIGFGLDIDSCLEYVINNNLIDIKNIKYLSYSNMDSYLFAMDNNNKLREKGIIVDTSVFDDLESTISYAKNNGYNKVLYYKDNNLEEISLGGE